MILIVNCWKRIWTGEGGWIVDKPLVNVDPDILGGTPVFYGTRVPIKNLTDYLIGGDSIEQFLDDFPTV